MSESKGKLFLVPQRNGWKTVPKRGSPAAALVDCGVLWGELELRQLCRPPAEGPQGWGTDCVDTEHTEGLKS